MKLFSLCGGMMILAALFLTACSKSSNQSPESSSDVPAFDHRPFDLLLTTFVGRDGWVDYDGLKKERARLDQYLAILANAKPQEFPNNAERLAFWINAYNAHTLADVLDHVYGKHKSVKDVEKEFFKTRTHNVAGEQLTLDQIEQKGRDLKDPRIHFAVNCASASCPKLQKRAYNGPELEAQLSRVAREFLADPSRGLNYQPSENTAYLSPIFKWYAADFTNENSVVARVKAEASGEELLEVVKKFIPTDVAQFFNEKKPKVDYLTYDWSLNDKAVQKDIPVSPTVKPTKK